MRSTFQLNQLWLRLEYAPRLGYTADRSTDHTKHHCNDLSHNCPLKSLFKRCSFEETSSGFMPLERSVLIAEARGFRAQCDKIRGILTYAGGNRDTYNN